MQLEASSMQLPPKSDSHAKRKTAFIGAPAAGRRDNAVAGSPLLIRF
jgi:hypothetical protein